MSPVSVGVLGAALPEAARAQPIDEPSDREHGQQGCNDQAYADEHIGENDGGAAVDVHGDPAQVRAALGRR
jgi:hypothetical protein